MLLVCVCVCVVCVCDKLILNDLSRSLYLPLSLHASIEFLRHVRDFFQIMFKIETRKPLDDKRKGGRPEEYNV